MHTAILASITGLALIYDPSGTVTLLTRALTVRGVTWIVKKITENINSDASQIIDFTGWSIAGVSIVGIISNAMGSIGEVRQLAVNITTVITQTSIKFAELVDMITFWN